jgi:hypothetical protein
MSDRSNEILAHFNPNYFSNLSDPRNSIGPNEMMSSYPSAQSCSLETLPSSSRHTLPPSPPPPSHDDLNGPMISSSHGQFVPSPDDSYEQ